MSSKIQALSTRSRLLSLDFKRAARLRWCKPFDVALSILETVSRYACSDASRSRVLMVFKNFLIDERRAERWLILCSRCLAFCRARFLAWGVLAKEFSSESRSVNQGMEYPRFYVACQGQKSVAGGNP